MESKIKSSVYFADALSKINDKFKSDYISLNDILNIFGDSGRFILCMLLSTPFLIPISIPGSSVPFGLAIMFIGFGLITNRFLIPKKITDYKIKKTNVISIFQASKTVLEKFEKIFKPRVLILTKNNSINLINGILLVFSSFLLMLPLPIPLTDTLPAYSIFLLSAGILERDGFFIIISYALIIITSVYFALILIFGFEVIYYIASYFGINLPVI